MRKQETYEIAETERPQIRETQNHRNIPDALKTAVKFCCWRYEWDDSTKTKMTKPPYNPITGNKGNDEKTFVGYDIAEKHFLSDKKANGRMKYDGIGFRVAEGFTALDFDHCIENGIIDPDVQELIEYFHSYTEVSPSGTGIRIVCLTKDLRVPKGDEEVKDFRDKYYENNRAFGREVYIAGLAKHYCSLTGNTLSSVFEGLYPEYELGERSEEVQNFLDKYMLKPQRKKNTENAVPYIPSPEDALTDEELISLMLSAQNSEDTRLLWDGDYSNHMHIDKSKIGEPDHSAGDLSLCSRIAFYASDKDQIDRVFRESGMYREKWERDDYREDTINKAIEGLTGHYSKSFRSEQDSVKSSFGDMVYTDIVDSSGTDTGSENSATETLDELKERLLRQSNFFAFDKFEEQVKDPDNVPWPTGLYDLDEKLGGGIFPEFIIIGAPPSMGKSALVEQIADTFARDGHDVFYYSFEMAREQLMARSISRIAYLEDLRRHGNHKLSKDFRSVYCGYLRKNFTDEERELISWAEEEYQENYARHVYVFDRSNATIESIEKNIEVWFKAFHTAPTIVVDYLQITPYKDNLKLSTDKMVLDYVTGILQKIQRKYKNRVILISSLNRAGSSKQEMQSFSGSSGIEYSADSLLTLYDWKTASDEEKKKIPEQIKNLYENCKKHGYAYGMRIALLKQRFGIKGVSVDIAANLKYSCFMDSREDDKPSAAESSDWMQITQQEKED